MFLPSFPILDMSDLELEQAEIVPRRWIELCNTLSAQGGDSEVKLSPTTTRIVDKPFASGRVTRLFLVPGGWYMVGFSLSGLEVWDLGYTSNANCKLIASIGPECGSSSGEVHATPDGKGLVIFTEYLDDHCSFYEIYPQSENPRLVKIACLGLPSGYNPPDFISPDIIIWSDHHIRQQTIFRVWYYRLNASVSFAVSDAVNLYNAKVVATQTAILVLHEADIFICTILPLSPQPPNFNDYSLTQSPPTVKVKLPDGILPHQVTTWRTVSSWYFDPSKLLYFDRLYSWLSRIQRFKFIIEPDFSDATLHLINTIQLKTHDFGWETLPQFMLCEDTLVYTWMSYFRCGLYTSSTLSHPTFHGGSSMTKISLALDMSRKFSVCPATGRLIHLHPEHHTVDKILVSDFLPNRKL